MPPVVTATEIPGLDLFARGHVRDLYDLDSQLLVVTTDRVEAHGHLLPTAVPDKGRVLNQLSAFWFDFLQNLAPSHYLSSDVTQITRLLATYGVRAREELLAGRSMLVNKARPMPIQVVVRGCLAGRTWAECQASGTVVGHPLPPGLREGDRLPEPVVEVFRRSGVESPELRVESAEGSVSQLSTLNAQLSEEPLTMEQMVHLMEPGHLHQMIDLSRALYREAAAYALEKRVIIADAAFDFGLFQGMVILIGECLTPDCARLWDADTSRPGGPQADFGRDYLLRYLEGTGWNRQPPAPPLPDDIVRHAADRYREAFRRLTGSELE